MIRGEIKKLIQDAIKALQKSGALSGGEPSPYGRSGEEGPAAKIEYPAGPKFGDYSTNIAFLLAPLAKQPPGLLASMMAEKIGGMKEAKKMFEKVEAAGAGFVNFTLSKEFIQKQLPYVGFRKSHIGLGAGKGRKLNIEFLSANPTGKFHVGNGRAAFFGDALGNVLKLAGFKVTKEYYVNNAKSSNQIQEFGKTALGVGEKYLTPYIKEKIEGLTTSPPHPLSRLARSAKRALVRRGGEVEVFGEAGFLLAQKIHKDNQVFLKKIGINFDIFTEEEKLYTRGLLGKTLAFLKKSELVYEKDGALWLTTTRFGDDKDKVVVRTDGDYGYYLGDIAYHFDKMKRGYKHIIDVFGADHQGHVLPLKIAMRILGYTGRFDVLVSQLVQTKGGGKFSKREGNIVELEELVSEVGVDAVRFFYLAKSPDTQMEFDLDLAKEQSEKNPVYYVQYAHARMASILRRAGEPPLLTKARFAERARRERGRGGEVVSKLAHPSELNLIKYLLRWPEIVLDTANDYQVQRVTAYATELATVFNQFYRDCKVICDDTKLEEARLGLVVVTQKVFKEVLGTLGISAPEKM